MKALNLIYGEEDLLRFEALDALRQKAKNTGFEEREILLVETSFNWQNLAMAFENVSLFAVKKLIEIHIPSGKPGKMGGDELQALPAKLAHRGDLSVVIFLPKLDRSQQQTKWFKTIKEAAEVTEAKAILKTQLPLWIKQRLANYRLRIEEEALLLFADRVEGNLLAASQEIEKMALIYAPDTILGFAEIQQAIAQVARFDIFQLSEAWMKGDLQRLMKLLDGLQEEEIEPVLLLWIISDDIRTLFLFSGAMRKGEDPYAIRKSLRLWGNKLQHVQVAAKRISPRRLISALQQCAQIDRQIKGVEAGDLWLNIHQLLISLAS